MVGPEKVSIDVNVGMAAIECKICPLVADGLDRGVAEVEAPDYISDLDRQGENAGYEVWSLSSERYVSEAS